MKISLSELMARCVPLATQDPTQPVVYEVPAGATLRVPPEAGRDYERVRLEARDWEILGRRGDRWQLQAVMRNPADDPPWERWLAHETLEHAVSVGCTLHVPPFDEQGP